MSVRPAERPRPFRTKPTRARLAARPCIRPTVDAAIGSVRVGAAGTFGRTFGSRAASEEDCRSVRAGARSLRGRGAAGACGAADEGGGRGRRRRARRGRRIFFGATSRKGGANDSFSGHAASPDRIAPVPESGLAAGAGSALRPVLGPGWTVRRRQDRTALQFAGMRLTAPRPTAFPAASPAGDMASSCTGVPTRSGCVLLAGQGAGWRRSGMPARRPARGSGDAGGRILESSPLGASCIRSPFTHPRKASDDRLMHAVLRAAVRCMCMPVRFASSA